jgi:hypothetical protein
MAIAAAFHRLTLLDTSHRQRVRRALKTGADYVPVGTLASLVVEALT